MKIVDFILDKFFIHFTRLKDKKNNSSGLDMLIAVLLMIPAAIIVNSSKLIPIITRYYPFSLLFKNKMLHYNYRREKGLAVYLEKQMNRRKNPFYVNGLDYDRYFTTFHGYFLNKPGKMMEKLLAEIVEAKLHLEKGNVFVRDVDKNKVKILVPTENLAPES